MPRYLVMQGEGWEPDSRIIEASTPEEALEDWHRCAYYRETKTIVAEIKLEVDAT